MELRVDTTKIFDDFQNHFEKKIINEYYFQHLSDQENQLS